jgi:hypothetical protein
MKLLVIYVSGSLHDGLDANFEETKRNLLKISGLTQLDFACVSSKDDFDNYKKYFDFKYTLVCPDLQLEKLCKFFDKFKHEFEYDWYIKIRPEVVLLEPIRFEKLKAGAVNARSRIYIGPENIPNGSVGGGDGLWSSIDLNAYAPDLKLLILDDQFFIFDKIVVDAGGFKLLEENESIVWENSTIFLKDLQNETTHTELWKNRGIGINLIGIYSAFRRPFQTDYCYSTGTLD